MAEYIICDKQDLDVIADAIREKAKSVDVMNFPNGFLETISEISKGMRVETGSVTLSETLKTYTFVDDFPDIFIFYLANGDNAVYSKKKGVWAAVQIKSDNLIYVFGYNQGTSVYYVPYKCVSGNSITTGRFSNSAFNGLLLADTYNWIAIYEP